MPDPSHRSEAVHASCVALGRAGLLIRGPSGSGKSTLALLLLDRAALVGTPAALVADDRVRLTCDGTAVIAHGDPVLADRIEVRGLGLLRANDTLSSVPVRLVVDLVAELPRLPERPLASVVLLDHALPALRLDPALLRSGLGPRLVLDALAGCGGVALGTHRAILTLPPDPGP